MSCPVIIQQFVAKKELYNNTRGQKKTRSHYTLVSTKVKEIVTLQLIVSAYVDVVIDNSLFHDTHSLHYYY